MQTEMGTDLPYAQIPASRSETLTFSALAILTRLSTHGDSTPR